MSVYGISSAITPNSAESVVSTVKTDNSLSIALSVIVFKSMLIVGFTICTLNCGNLYVMIICFYESVVPVTVKVRHGIKLALVATPCESTVPPAPSNLNESVALPAVLVDDHRPPNAGVKLNGA